MILVNTRGKKEHKYNKDVPYTFYKGIIMGDDIVHVKTLPSTIIKYEKKHTHAVLIVHGFNSNKGNAVEAYETIESHINDVPCDYYGYLWANRGKWWAYFSDLRRTKEGGERLKHLINKLKNHLEYEKVSIICHSMGSYLVMNMLAKYGSNLGIYKISIMGGDTKLKKYRLWGKYGMRSDDIVSLDSYYSKYDRVLNWFGDKIRWGRRVGNYPFGNSTPDNYHSIDANIHTMADHKVRHKDYKNMKTLLQRAINRIIQS